MENESLTSVLENLDAAALEQLLQARRANCDENAETQGNADVSVAAQPESVEFDKEFFIN